MLVLKTDPRALSDRIMRVNAKRLHDKVERLERCTYCGQADCPHGVDQSWNKTWRRRVR